MRDCIIVGGGPAGLAAAIHLAWHDHDVLVIDRRSGPLFFTVEQLHNVPGMPAARGMDIQKQLKAQAESMGAEIIRDNVTSATGTAGEFTLVGESGEEWSTKSILLATGVARYHPDIEGNHRVCFKYAGKGNMYYCPDCEAPEIRDKDTILIGSIGANAAAGMAIGLSSYTDRLRVLLTAGTELSERYSKKLEELGIQVQIGKIKELVGPSGALRSLILEDGTQMDAEAFFVSASVIGRTELATKLGVDLASTKTHAQPKSQRGDTNIKGVWIAGDLRPMTQQVSVAMGTGNIAAVMVNQWLQALDLR
jgi:thioredoxin reductase (NADPH)